MELKDLVRVLAKQWLAGIIVLLAITVLGALVINFLPSRFYAAFNVGLRMVGSQETAEYKYDGYYELQAADLFADTVTGMFSSPEVVKEVYEVAGLEVGTDNLRKLSTIFDAKKTSSQSVAVKFSATDEAEADKLVDALDTVIKRRVDELSSMSDKETKFSVFLDKPIIVPRDLDMMMVGGMIGLTALIMAAAVMLVRDYASRN